LRLRGPTKVPRMTTPPLTGSVAEQTLAVQLEQAGLVFDREVQFAKHLGRKWRADFGIYPTKPGRNGRLLTAILVEIDGGGWVQGHHSRGKGIEDDAEKQSAAAILGFRVIRATPRQVENGTALSWIRQALGIERAA
jgi:hypothetical protein